MSTQHCMKPLATRTVFTVIGLLLLVLFMEIKAQTVPNYSHKEQVVVFLTVPDSSHVRDFQALAKAYSIVSGIRKQNIHFVSFVNDFEIDHDGKFNIIQCKIDDRFNFKETMDNLSVYAKSEIPKMDRFKAAFTIISKAYEMGIVGIKDLFNEKSNCDLSLANTLKQSREGKIRLLLVIDGLFSSVLEWSQFEGIEFVIIDTPPIMYGYSGGPSYLPQLPIAETSLSRGRAILERDGIVSYLKTQLQEQVFEFIEFIKMAYPTLGEVTKLREELGLPAVSGPFFETNDKVTIHFTIPGIFEYSFPVPQNHKFVGFNHIEKSPATRQIIGSDSNTSIDEIQDEMVWLDAIAGKKKKVVYIAFGTKVIISLDHTRKMIQAIMKSDPSLNILFVSNSENKDKIFGDSSMDKEWSKQILIKKWVKQVEVLRHPVVSIFVSHAGAHSLFESIDATVPLLLFPIFGDQFLNSIRAEDAGIGKTIHDLENQEETIKSIRFLLEKSNEISQKMETIKLINKEMAALGVNREILQRVLESNATSTLSPASLSAATIIRQVALFGSEQFVSTEHKLFAIEKVNIMRTFLIICASLIIGPIILFAICCCKKKVNKKVKTQ
ncbi:predicted protein [Naegleria gruberi]|uniref:Predicted protein n=1 Tax=Naegleria gruberi TaxID=5762 RepID=D2W073_NAEGR|nr:uncharacterized protein NAEGRDRAFT_53666 [Naegleria gruberi]EFC37567.1 predicted protein [Naegleria gruberi]|eukprot:XP_002670311.1 predicted protein [Naegleria gruberi strain NEG-M]